MSPVIPTSASPATRSARLRWAALALAVAGLIAGLVLQWKVQRLGGVGPGRYRLLTLILIWQAIALATAALLRWIRPRKIAAGLILAGLVLVPAASLTRGSQISDDLYRYAWDGRVQAAGIDPYRYAPQAGELASFRDAWLWPDTKTCTELGKRTSGDDPSHACTRINRPSVRTIYPPVAEGYFLLAHVLPGPEHDHRLQLDAAVLSALLTGLLAFGLRRTGRDPLGCAYYAFGPMAALNVVGDAHVDALGAIFGVAAVLVATLRPRAPGRAGLLAGLAIAVKLYPVLLLPALLRREGGRKGALRLVAAAAGVVVVGYLPHVIAVGPHVLGYLPGYLHEERYDTGTRFLLLGLLGLNGAAAKALAVLILASAVGFVAVRSWQERISPATGVLTVFGAAFLVATPAEPWYALLLVCMAVLTGRLEWFAVATAAYPLYVTSLIHESPIGVGQFSYALAAVFVLLTALFRRSRATQRMSNLGTTANQYATSCELPIAGNQRPESGRSPADI